jgi:putative flippase GtrA
MESQKIRYLLAGGWNTIFGYSLGVSLYVLLSPGLNTFVIAILANVIAISMSFLIYKVFVFRTTGEWLREYLRSYVSYGSKALLGVFLFWFLVDVFGMNIWLTQFLCITMTATLSYFANKYFTFKRKK